MELQSDFDIKEACGVFGIFSPKEEDVASSIYYGLCSLQHRGQESCGIAVCDTKGPKGNMNAHKGMGLVSEVFKEEILENLHGNLGIGPLFHYRGCHIVKRAASGTELYKGNTCSGP